MVLKFSMSNQLLTDAAAGLRARPSVGSKAWRSDSHKSQRGPNLHGMDSCQEQVVLPQGTW